MRFKKKTGKLLSFMDDLQAFTSAHPEAKKLKLKRLNETHLQIAFRSILIDFLERYFRQNGYQKSNDKAHQELYWEGNRESLPGTAQKVFAARNYPDYVIKSPYRIAIEYKQGEYGSLVKQGIGQAVLHTVSGEYDFAVVLFHDKSKRKKIKRSAKQSTEQRITAQLRTEFNVFVMFV
eukprot:COSAG01_NODE_46_length_32080_cov_716.589319_13_plen_178_part_00